MPAIDFKAAEIYAFLFQPAVVGQFGYFAGTLAGGVIDVPGAFAVRLLALGVLLPVIL